MLLGQGLVWAGGLVRWSWAVVVVVVVVVETAVSVKLSQPTG